MIEPTEPNIDFRGETTFPRREVVRRREMIAVFAFAFATLAFFAHVVRAAPPADDDLKARLPRLKAVEPEDALKTFATRDGYQMELVAAEPLVASPVAIDFDSAGRMYVVEMRDYSEQATEKLGRVRLLTDRDGDGRYDDAIAFAEGLSWPTGVVCANGGVFVCAAPDLWFLKDTDGDGRADIREVVITGFSRANVQGMVNSLRWTLDGRIHGATGNAGGELRVVAKRALNGQPPATTKTLSARGRDFSFDPRTLDLRLESGGGQHGMSFDDWGRKFACSNSNHIQLVMYEDRHAARNPRLAAPPPLVDIAADGPAAEVFRRSPVEPWRIVRTEWRVSGKVPGIIEGGGRAAGYFTSATGVTIYRGDAWPSADRGLAIVGDVGSNLIHRKRLEANGVGLTARRIDANSEFVASTDTWFRPVQFANSPDGCLYAIDMYRETIEHPASLPPAIKQYLDLTSGRDRGRIYRIAPPGYRKRPPARLDGLDTPALVALLANDNGWHRDTASRLLVERGNAAAAPLLAKMVRECKQPLGRLHALYVLAATGALADAELCVALADRHPGVREHAARLAPRVASANVVAGLFSLSGDESALVRYQTAFSLGEISQRLATDAQQRTRVALTGPVLTKALARIALADADDRYVRFATLGAAAGYIDELIVALLHAKPEDAARAGLRGLLADAVRLWGGEIRSENIQSVRHLIAEIDALAKEKAPLAFDLTLSLAEGLRRGSAEAKALLATDREVGQLVKRRAADAVMVAADAGRPVATRQAAAAMLALVPFGESRPVLSSLLAAQSPPDLQLAAIGVLGRSTDAAAADELITAWTALGPAARGEALSALLARDERLPLTLSAIADGKLAGAIIEPARAKALADHRNPAIRELAKRALGSSASPSREARDKLIAEFRGSLASGDVGRGQAAFRRTCAACHRLDDVGHVVGPDLAAIRNRGPDGILLAVLDPNREVNPQYMGYTLRTTDGRTITGMIATETATSVTLRRAEAVAETVIRDDIDELRSSGMSLMPEGLEKQLSKQDIADIVAYLMSRK